MHPTIKSAWIIRRFVGRIVRYALDQQVATERYLTQKVERVLVDAAKAELAARQAHKDAQAEWQRTYNEVMEFNRGAYAHD